MPSRASRARDTLGAIRALLGARLLGPMHPAKYWRMARIVRSGVDATAGIRLAAIRRPDAPGVVDELGSISWKDLDRDADSFAVGLLAELGNRPRAVGVLCRNHRGFVLAVQAAGRLGSDVVLLNTSFAGPQLRDVVEREGVEVLVHDAEFDAVAAHVDSLPRPPTRVLGWTDGTIDRLSIESLASAHRDQELPPPPSPGRIVLLTSGTTAAPKGARRPSGGSATSLLAILRAIPWRAGSTVVVAAPMFHAWGFSQTLIAASMACTIVTTRRFDAAEVLRLAQAHDARGLVVVPVMIERIMDLPAAERRGFALPSLRFVTASGSRMRPDAVLAFMDEFGDVVHNNYNATEAGMISIAGPADLRAAPETAGRPALGTELRVVDDEGAEVPTGAIGRIAVRNDSMFDGYTTGDTKAFVDGYMLTGDVGRLDGDGRLFVVGRDDDMIVSGGENVHPIEVERALQAHPAVRDAVVYGVPDDRFGERLVAFVVADTAPTVGEEQLKEHVRAQLASFKVPRSITMVDELPRNPAGKIAKRELLETLDPRGDR